MSDSDRPLLPEEASVDKPPRTDAALPVAGRSVPVGEIGRELGDLDFEPDDLLASLRPFEPDLLHSETSAGAAPPDVAPGSPALSAPKLPQLQHTERPSTSSWDLVPAREPIAPSTDDAPTTTAAVAATDLGPATSPDETFEPDEASTQALPTSAVNPAPPIDFPASVRPKVALSPAVQSRSSSRAVPIPRERLQLPKRPIAPPRPPGPRSTSIRQPDPKSYYDAATPPRLHEPTTAPGFPLEPPPPVASRESAAVSHPNEILDNEVLGNEILAKAVDSSVPAQGITDFDGPEVVTNDDASILEELMALPPDRSESLCFEAERPAFEHLAERDLVDAYHSMAVILTKEAQAPRHPQEQAEIAVVNSELLALLGELDTAREYLHALAETTTPATALLTRQLAFAAEDFPAYARAIKAELRTNISLESRRHLMALYCDVLRLVPEGEAEIRRHLELSSRAFPSDPRFMLQRLAVQFADRNHPKLRTPNVLESPQLTEAIRDLAALRTGPVQSGGCAHPAGPLMMARRAWQQRNLDQLLCAILDLRSIDALASGAAWLHASLTALNPRFRDTDVSFVDQLAEEGDEEAEAALLERRLHAKTNMLSSVEAFSTKTVASLSPVERLSLGVALATSRDTLQLLSDSVTSDSPNSPLASAVQRLFALRSTSPDSSDIHSIRMTLGHALGSLRGSVVESGAPNPSLAPPASRSKPDSEQSNPEDPLPSRNANTSSGTFADDVLTNLIQLEQLDPENRYVKVLRFRDHLSRTDPGELALATIDLLPQISTIEPACLSLLGAFLAELGQSKELEAKLLLLASPQEPPLETIYRARLACDSSLKPRVILRELASRLGASPRRTWLEFEASAADRSTPEALEEFLQQEHGSTPALEALTTLLLATLPKPSTLGWLKLATQAKTPEVRVLSGVFNALCQESVTPSDGSAGSLLDDIAVPGYDPLIGSLLAALGRGMEPVRRSDSTDDFAPDGALDDWLRIRHTAAKLPFDLDPLGADELQDLATRHPEPLLTSVANLVYTVNQGNQAAFERQLAVAEAASTTEERVDALAEAGELDPNREPGLGSIEVARRILAHRPEHLLALRLLLRHAARHEEMVIAGRIAAQMAPQLEPAERLAHAWLGVVSTVYDTDTDSNLEQTAHLDALLGQDDATPLWASRRLLELARLRHDDQRILRYTDQLRQSTSRAFDAATLALRAAEAASRLAQWDSVGELLDLAIQQCPEHLVALSLRAEFLEARGESNQAAVAYDALADAACMPTHKVAAWIHAATLWSDSSCGDEASELAQLALERAVQLEPTHAEATARLRAMYVAHKQLDRLEELLTQLLLRVDDAKDRAQLELERARVLIDLERADEAQGGLERVLSLLPDQQDALDLSARLYEQQQDFEGAEQQWLRLASLPSDESRQAEVYQRLAQLYETHLEQPARAESAYREVLRRRPNDPSADQLVQLLLRNENPTGAVELLQQLLSHSTDPDLERTRSVQLARIFDEILGDRRRAEEILDRTRRRWQNDASTISALAAFYRRGRDFVALGALLDRSLADARRALGSGRFDPTFFEVIACVAEQRELHDFVRTTNATLAAIQARAYPMNGIGARAAEDTFADSLAPEVLSLPLRALLRKTGWALCAAHPIQLRTLRASPLADTHLELSEHLRDLAGSFGQTEIDLHLSPALGMACQATSSSPATLVVGPDFASLDDHGVRDALAIRALRILSANAAALANTAPVDLWPLLVAYLSAYLPDWLPPGLDPAKIAPLRERIQRVLPRLPDTNLPVLAADVAASIGNRASQLGIAVQQWGSRTALLALGDPGTVLTAIAAASGQLDRITEDPAERQKWIVRNPEARDLAIFSVTDAYVEARAKVFGKH